jgi:hypothetical protein
MSGPIVRSAPNKKFSSNWDSVFGGKVKASGAKAKSKDKPAAKKTAKKKKP